MKLTYRGVTYEKEPLTLEMEQGEIGGHYRGQDWYYQYPRHIPQLKPKLYRQYRGVAYSTAPIPFNHSHPGEQLPVKGNVCPFCVTKPKQTDFDETSQVHLDNMRRSLERRLKVAQSRGDNQLVNLLQQESRKLALNT